MTPQMIDNFFLELDKELKAPAKVIITGAAAGALMGHIRPSVDIDFEINFLGRGAAVAAESAGAKIDRVVRKSGIAAQYSTYIGGWGQIKLLDYRKTAVFYKKIGLIELQLLAPEYWTIGKMARYVDLDISDIAHIIKIKKILPDRLIKIWAKALKTSALSDSSREFKNHVVDFLENQGKKVWGRKFESAEMILRFKKLAGMR